MRLAAYPTLDSVVDGPGLRAVIWTQGCPHHCPGCHNPQTHDPRGGRDIPLNIIKKIIKNQGQTGITFSGGDPMMQPEECAKLARWAHKNNLDVWCYTGYTFEELQKKPETHEFLKEIDVLVDGRFVQSKKSLDCLWRGSTNQRIIHLKGGEVSWLEKELDSNITEESQDI